MLKDIVATSPEAVKVWLATAPVIGVESSSIITVRGAGIVVPASGLTEPWKEALYIPDSLITTLVVPGVCEIDDPVTSGVWLNVSAPPAVEV